VGGGARRTTPLKVSPRAGLAQNTASSVGSGSSSEASKALVALERGEGARPPSPRRRTPAAPRWDGRLECRRACIAATTAPSWTSRVPCRGTLGWATDKDPTGRCRARRVEGGPLSAIRVPLPSTVIVRPKASRGRPPRPMPGCARSAVSGVTVQVAVSPRAWRAPQGRSSAGTLVRDVGDLHERRRLARESPRCHALGNATDSDKG